MWKKVICIFWFPGVLNYAKYYFALRTHSISLVPSNFKNSILMDLAWIPLSNKKVLLTFLFEGPSLAFSSQVCCFSRKKILLQPTEQDKYIRSWHKNATLRLLKGTVIIEASRWIKETRLWLSRSHWLHKDFLNIMF